MKLTPVYLDFESFWSDTHTLSKMTPEAYVTHPDTEIISMSIRVKDEPTMVFFGEDSIKRKLDSVDWSDKLAIGHNMSGFDSLILAWRFGVKPAMWACTAAMARPKYAKTCGVSLAALCKELGIGVKDNTALMNTKGKHLKDFTQAEIAHMKVYNRDDTDLCAELFKRLMKGFPPAELLQVHLTTQMRVNPVFELDTSMVEVALSMERDSKRRAVLELAKLLRVDIQAPSLNWHDEDAVAEFIRSELASAPRFAKLLEEYGVEVPMKPSPTNPGKMVPALAKTDEDFLKLKEHPNEIVAAAARVRLSVKSTLLETRLEAFLKSASYCNGYLPVPLKYCGADTTGRWSGEQYNMQNLPRIPRDKQGNIVTKPSNALRMSLKAPKGHKVMVADLSGIELRVNHFLWKVASSMALFQADPEKADLYKQFASALYDITVGEVSKDQRQVGKVAHLGLGFGAGPATFQKVARLMAGIDMPEEEAIAVVRAWRDEYTEIVGGWAAFQNALPSILNGAEVPIDPWGLCVTELNAVRLPSGRRIYYPGLRKEREPSSGKTEWWYGQGRHKARIYAGKGVENLVQALARDVIADCAGTFWKQTGMEPALTVHDELVYVVPESDAEALLQGLQTIMRTPPKWWPELITWSEGDIAQSYGQAK